MNKYFLSLMSILILFQSFKVLDEILYHNDKNIKKGFIIINEAIKEPRLENDELQVKEVDLGLLLTQADIEKGIKISKQCVACHDFSKNLKIKVGPPLWGVVGRDSGIISDFSYSSALINFKKIWTKQELFYFLEAPKGYIKGTKMIYKGLNKIDDRVNLISYLESLK